MPRKALLLINEASGAASRLGASAITELAASALARLERGLDVFSGDCASLIACARRARRFRDLVICAGGDGTLAAVAGALAGSPCALAPMPCGTMNLFSRDLGLPTDPGEAVRAALEGEEALVDICRVGKRAFLNNVVFGVYAEIAEAREELRDATSIGEVGSAIAAAAGALLSAAPSRYRIRIDRRTVELTTNALIIYNNAVSGAAGIAPTRARLDDGCLSVYLSRVQTAGGFAATLLSFARGDPDSQGHIDQVRCRRCVVASAEPMHFTVDGDPQHDAGPVTLSVRRRALKVCRPSLRARSESSRGTCGTSDGFLIETRRRSRRRVGAVSTITPNEETCMTKHVIAVFRDKTRAERAASDLAAAGYPQDRISVLMGQGYHGRTFGIEAGNKAAEGAATGGALGGTLGAVVAGLAATGAVAATGGAGLLASGPIVAALTGAGAGAAAGGALGGLVGLGIPEHRAKIYQDVIAKDGGLLLGVEAPQSEVDDVKTILKSAGGENLSVE